MPARTWQTRFQDIIEAAAQIDQHIHNIRYEDFLQDPKTIDAVIRQLITIGEAVSQTEDSQLARIPHINWRAIIGMRNILTHEYFQVNNTIVWHTATQDIPTLTPQLQTILNHTQP